MSLWIVATAVASLYVLILLLWLTVLVPQPGRLERGTEKQAETTAERRCQVTLNPKETDD